MRTEHLKRIRCIQCGGELEAAASGEVVENGLVECRECSARFPVIRFMRVFTTRLPLPVVLWISRLFAVPAYLFFKLPGSVLSKSEYVQEVSDQYPTHQTEQRKPDFDLLTHNWFDHFTPPIIGWYSDEEVLTMLADTGLELLELKYGIFRGYKAP